MSWRIAEGRLMAAKVDTVRVSVKPVTGNQNTRGARNNILFYVGHYVGEKIGWSSSARVNLYWGEGKDEGWCRVELAHDGRLKMRQSGKRTIGSYFFKTHQHPKNGGCLGSLTEVKFQITPDNALLVKMPAWFWRAYEKKRPDTNIGRPRQEDRQRGRQSPADAPALLGAAAE